jgi:uncharacterized protein
MKKILEAVVGSTLHGISVEDGLEDLDLMAIILESPSDCIGFNRKDTWVERTKPDGVRSEAGDIDWVGYGLGRYVKLCLSGNPSVLLALFVPQEQTRLATQEGKELQELKGKIISKSVYPRFKGFLRSLSIKRTPNSTKQPTRPELVNKFGYDTKDTAHAIRLGLQGAELLREGLISLPMQAEHKKLCIDVRKGLYSLEESEKLVRSAEEELDKAYSRSQLPETPQSDLVEKWVIEKYLNYWNSL